MKKAILIPLAALLAAGATAAPAQTGNTQYISDEISVSIREAPRNDAGMIGIIKSGARVTVLESLGPESFARIRTADGRTGWITARFLTNQPAAGVRVLEMRGELDTAKQQLRTLESELAAARAQLDKARPAFELSQENEKLKAEAAEQARANEELRRQYDAARQQRKTMLTGAGLLSGGVILGLVLPTLLRSRRRRYSDF
jgi:SH3 domain protein